MTIVWITDARYMRKPRNRGRRCERIVTIAPKPMPSVLSKYSLRPLPSVIKARSTVDDFAARARAQALCLIFSSRRCRAQNHYQSRRAQRQGLDVYAREPA
jgi:hypothetical protein